MDIVSALKQHLQVHPTPPHLPFDDPPLVSMHMVRQLLTYTELVLDWHVIATTVLQFFPMAAKVILERDSQYDDEGGSTHCITRVSVFDETNVELDLDNLAEQTKWDEVCYGFPTESSELFDVWVSLHTPPACPAWIENGLVLEHLAVLRAWAVLLSATLGKAPGP